MDELWHFVVGPIGFVLFSEHLPFAPCTKIPSSLTSSTIRKAAALHAYIYYFLSFFPRGLDRAISAFPPTRCYTYRRTAPPSIHIIITYSSHSYAHYMFFLYIYVYILLSITSRIYIYMNTLPHARTHTHTLYIAICVLVYIYMFIYIYTHNNLHIYYIIVLYVSEKERPVDYGRSAFFSRE